MYHTWFFLKRLAPELNDKLTGLRLLECFSQQKDELIFSFGDKNHEFHIKADMDSQAGLLSFQESFARARRNSVDLFPEILDSKVVSVECFSHERSLKVSFENDYFLIFKMHGRRSNVLLAANDKVLKIFRNSLPADLEIIPSELDNSMELNEPNILRLLGRSNSYLIENQYDNSYDLINKFNYNSISIDLKDDAAVLSLLPVPNPIHVTKVAIEAANEFVKLHYRHFLFGKEKKEVQSVISKKVRQGAYYIEKTSKKLQDLKDQRSLEEIANLLMANLHQVPANKSEIVLDDFYHNQPITIKLNPKLSPQKNAENYYRKNKNKKLEFDNLRSNIESKQADLSRLENALIELDQIDSLKDLRVFKTRFDKTLGKNEKAPLPYFQFDIRGWITLVGKNAKSNDILTQKIAAKNDLWLHARDVAGSHVVVRGKPGTKFPADIIEKAAALAAWYSKRKTDSLCPVIYTPKKFVRKIKGALPGQVVVDKEEVVMVEPSNQL